MRHAKPVLVLLLLSLAAAARHSPHGPAKPPVHRGRHLSAHAPPAHATPPGRHAAIPEQKALSSAAPVPDERVVAPVAPEEARTHVSPTLFDLGIRYQGDGYTYGSSPQAMDDRRSAHVPGLSLKVPLQ